MTPGAYVYLNFAQRKNEDSLTIGGFLPLEKVYNYEPVPAAIPTEKVHYVIGAQANFWSEYLGNESIAGYMLFPRLSALSEVLWSPKESRNYQDFLSRLPAQAARYELWKTNYYKGPY
jgi:hexosaminidase